MEPTNQKSSFSILTRWAFQVYVGVVTILPCLLQADEVAQVEFQKRYGFVKKPTTPRKISSVRAD